MLWSVAPVSAPASCSFSAISRRSPSVWTSQAMWYSPTVARPACDGPAPSPIENSPRSWSLSESGAWRNFAPGISITTRNPNTSR